MTFLRATVNVAELIREVKIGTFRRDKKKDYYDRYVYKLCHGVEGAILGRVLRLVREEESAEGVKMFVEVEPFCHHRVSFESCSLEGVFDLCDKLSELSCVVIKKYRADNV